MHRGDQAATDAVGQIDAPAMRFHHALDDGQPQTGAADRRIRPTYETLEHTLGFGCGNAGAMIGNGQYVMVAVAGERHLQRGTGTVFACVVDQVFQRLA